MVYALHKFRHFLLENKFVFYVDHMALVYLVNKPQVSGTTPRWLLLFLEYDFIIVYKLGRSHVVDDVLSRLLDSSKNIGCPISNYGCIIIFYGTYMVVGSENLFRDSQMLEILNLA